MPTAESPPAERGNIGIQLVTAPDFTYEMLDPRGTKALCGRLVRVVPQPQNHLPEIARNFLKPLSMGAGLWVMPRGLHQSHCSSSALCACLRSMQALQRGQVCWGGGGHADTVLCLPAVTCLLHRRDA
eukprot:363764-Chlamydomonas_euryale.AAC.19